MNCGLLTAYRVPFAGRLRNVAYKQSLEPVNGVTAVAMFPRTRRVMLVATAGDSELQEQDFTAHGVCCVASFLASKCKRRRGPPRLAMRH